jgi:hypothetical protein
MISDPSDNYNLLQVIDNGHYSVIIPTNIENDTIAGKKVCGPITISNIGR